MLTRESLERVAETGRLRFIDVNEEQERAVCDNIKVIIKLGQQTQLQTLSEYSHSLLPPNHPTTKRVRAVAARIIEGSGLGRVKVGDIGSVEANVPGWRSGGQAEPDIGELFMGGGGGDVARETKETEWEVSLLMANQGMLIGRCMSSMIGRRRMRSSCLAARSLSLRESYLSVRTMMGWPRC
jgi:hypothetical protein